MIGWMTKHGKVRRSVHTYILYLLNAVDDKSNFVNLIVFVLNITGKMR